MKKFSLYMFLLSTILLVSCKKNTGINIDPDTLVKDDIYEQLYEDSALNVLFTHYATENPNKKARGFQGCPTVGYKDGVYFVAWMCGVKGEEPGTYMCVSSSLDSGKTWSKNELLIVPKVDSCRQMDPCFWLDKGGDLHLSWTYVKKGMWDGGDGGLWHVKIKSEAGKILMTKPQQLGVGIMNVKPSNALEDTTAMYFPINNWNFSNAVYGGYNYYATPPDRNAPFLYKSIYDFKTKRFGKPQIVAKIPTQFSRTFDEQAFLDLGNGYLKCFFRTNKNGIAYAESKDAGKTWSKQMEFKALGETTDTRFVVTRLKSGNILFVLNNSTTRKNIVAYLSKDEGNTWPYKLVIEPYDCSYPDIIENEKNEIALVYDRKRVGVGMILFTKFTENDIVQGNAKAIKLVMVSQLQ